jgi:hypothetical protein
MTEVRDVGRNYSEEVTEVTRERETINVWLRNGM